MPTAHCVRPRAGRAAGAARWWGRHRPEDGAPTCRPNGSVAARPLGRRQREEGRGRPRRTAYGRAPEGRLAPFDGERTRGGRPNGKATGVSLEEERSRRRRADPGSRGARDMRKHLVWALVPLAIGFSCLLLVRRQPDLHTQEQQMKSGALRSLRGGDETQREEAVRTLLLSHHGTPPQL